MNSARACCCLVLLLYLCGLPSSPGAPSPGGRVYDVRTFGAKGDGKTLDTVALQAALTACAKGGGGVVRFPAGTYLSQPLTLGTATTLILEEGATLLASPDHKHFMKTPGDWLQAKSGSDFIALLSGKNLKNVVVKGKGVIDGNGGVWWEEAEKARQKVSGYTLPRPNLFTLERCKNVRITGITLRNSPKFHFVPSECEDVLVDGVTVLAPEGAANTDGIDPSNCRNVTITRCFIDCGDDNVAIKSGKKVPGREFACENIVVTNCVFKHGHGMSIGSETVGGVRNVFVSHCSFENTDNGLRIKSRRGRGGIVDGITYADCTLSNCHPAISMVGYYQTSTNDKFPKDDKPVAVTETTPQFRNITISNVVASSTTHVGLIVGLPECPVTNVVLENVVFSGTEGLTIANARRVRLKNVKVSVQQGESYLLHNAEGEGFPSGTRK